MSPAHRLKWAHLCLTVVWLVLIPIAHLTGWVDQTRFVSDLSLVALVLASASAYQATRAEVKVDQAAEVKADEVNVENAAEVKR